MAESPENPEAFRRSALQPGPVAMLLALGVLWGATPPLGKLAAHYGFHPVTFAFWQSGIAAVILAVMVAVRRRPLPLGRRYLFYYVMSGILGLGAPNAISFTALYHLPSGIMSVIITTVPLATYALSVVSGLERVRWRRVAGIGLGFSGCLLILLPGASLPSEGLVPWVLLGFLTPTLYAVTNVWVARYRPDGIDSLALACGMMIAAAVCMGSLALVLGVFQPVGPPFDGADAVALAHGTIASMAFVVYFALMQRAGPVYLSQVGYIVTLTGLIWAMAVFGERYGPGVWAAVLLIFAGLYTVNRDRRLAETGNESGAQKAPLP
ncbi:MAG: DMT family transporter, partial [Acetobacterales bacterium]